ncbi:YfcE family phosphodiesterase [Treponema bryantii]|uniref:YfcE family phosphodiesterase n=1 Tax=Treponema bryantii TaxID=163 RepID=UPI002B2EA8F8|nr:phosphoesterase [Treponema bryantii]
MIEISQHTQNIIGSRDAIAALETKDHARLLIISDSHGRYPVFESIVRGYGAKCDALIFCGDGVSDVATLLYKQKIDEKLAECVPPVIAAVRGNCDPSSYPLDKGSLYFSELIELKVNGRGILVTHGHNQGVDFGLETLGLEMQVSECSTAFYGHTHIAHEDTFKNFKIVNPGSCARPRGGQPAGFAIATVEKTFVDIAFIKMTLKNDGTTEYSLWSPY